MTSKKPSKYDEPISIPQTFEQAVKKAVTTPKPRKRPASPSTSQHAPKSGTTHGEKVKGSGGQMDEKGQVISVRLSADEVRQLRGVASRDDMKVSEIIREALATYAASNRDSTIEVSAPPVFRMYSYRGGPDTSDTYGVTREIGVPPSSGTATFTP